MRMTIDKRMSRRKGLEILQRHKLRKLNWTTLQVAKERSYQNKIIIFNTKDFDLQDNVEKVTRNFRSMNKPFPDDSIIPMTPPCASFAMICPIFPLAFYSTAITQYGHYVVAIESDIQTTRLVL